MLRTTSAFVAAARCALLAAALPWLSTVACGDDATPDAGSSAGSGGQGGSAGAAAGSAGSAGAAGAAGSGGSSAGSGGSSGSAGASAAGSGGSGGGDAGAEPDAGGGADASAGLFTLTSSAVDDVAGCGPEVGARDLCDLFPAENTGLNGAANVSPQFAWTGVPAGTQSFAIALHDLSNVMGSDPFTHWVMWNIPGSATGLPAELPEGTNPGVPDANARQVSFRGNQAFAGSGAPGNVYEFVLFALDTATFDPGSTNPDAVENAIAGSNAVLGTATLRARSTPN
jgi:Raf kinase inhibitor-like YbhB/YbcL family protein